MADKIYQVWRGETGEQTICYVSADYNSAVDYVVSLIMQYEEKRSKDVIERTEKSDAYLLVLNTQIAALKTIADNIAVQPILDELTRKRQMEIFYAKQRSRVTVQTADYYKENLIKYCKYYKIAIFDFDLDTELDICVDDLIDETMNYI